MEYTSPADKKLPLEEHLLELRNRLLVVISALAFFTLIFFIFSSDILLFINHAFIPAGTPLIILNPLEHMYMRFLLSVAGAICICFPLLMYELFKFMRPGMLPNETKFFITAVPASLVLFFVGALAAYFLVIPFSVKFLLSYAEGSVEPMLSLSRFISFIFFTFLSMGIIFQLPLIVSFMVKTNLVRHKDLKEKRKYVYGLLFVLAITIVPDPTPVTPLVILVTFVVVYEASILLAGLF
ncbi:MAG: twin-arginine translocase subunit TatC [Candidatus Hydrothermarchaeaceae archaeon]